MHDANHAILANLNLAHPNNRTSRDWANRLNKTVDQTIDLGSCLDPSSSNLSIKESSEDHVRHTTFPGVDEDHASRIA